MLSACLALLAHRRLLWIRKPLCPVHTQRRVVSLALDDYVLVDVEICGCDDAFVMCISHTATLFAVASEEFPWSCPGFMVVIWWLACFTVVCVVFNGSGLCVLQPR